MVYLEETGANCNVDELNVGARPDSVLSGAKSVVVSERRLFFSFFLFLFLLFFYFLHNAKQKGECTVDLYVE